MPAPAASHEPTVAEVIAPYRGLLELPGDAPALAALRTAAARMIAAAAGARSPQGLLATWTEGGHLVGLAAAPVIAEAEATLARQAAWPDPLRAAGARALIADVARARTRAGRAPGSGAFAPHEQAFVGALVPLFPVHIPARQRYHLGPHAASGTPADFAAWLAATCRRIAAEAAATVQAGHNTKSRLATRQ